MSKITYDIANRTLKSYDGWSMWFLSSSLQRRGRGVIGLYNWSGKDLMRWHKNGEIRIRTTALGWSDVLRINRCNPHNWVIWRSRGYTLIGKTSENGNVIKGKTLVLHPDGTIANKLGESNIELRKRMSHIDYVRNKPRRRGLYWIRRARNLYADRSKCKHLRGKYWLCGLRAGLGTEPRTYECGCRTYRKNIKFKGTVKSIMAEKNATVRTAMIKLYGITKFFTEAGAEQIDASHGYELLNLNLSGAQPGVDRWGGQLPILPIRALKMQCPSTGEVYVNAVPPTIQDV